ncbi:hypothetical protein ACFYY8_33610 [Streptosporangium sp. NPDC001559]|uniref:hypothetical protein n=1 Tax=Streptosporangium sp. NPDC001559 TaxID=3366187 RepID=UPI0036E0E0C4
MRQTVYNSVKVVQVIAPGAQRTNGAVNGTAVDRLQAGVWFRSAMIVVHSGAITDGTHTVTVEESDNGTDWTAVATADLQGAPPAIGGSDDNKLWEIGYVGSKRYIRPVLTTATATTGGYVDALVLLGVRPVQRP